MRTLTACTFTILLVLHFETAAQEKIAFASAVDGDSEIWVMDTDGSNKVNLTNNSVQDTSPSFSPDGRRIAFNSNRDGNTEIYIMNADGTDQVRLTNNPAFDGVGAFNHDGSKILFGSLRDGLAEIYVMNADGTNQVRLTFNSVNDASPSFNHDGSKIAFESNRDGNNEIYIMNADGSDQINLSNNPAHDEDPSFSTNGSRIAFVSGRDGNREIYSMNPDGTSLFRVTNTAGNDSQPAYSPDGNMIVHRAVVGTNPDIWVINSTGGTRTNLTNTDVVEESGPSWGGVPIRRPVMIVPGIGGTYSANTSNDLAWVLNRGTHLDQMQIDPLAKAYHDLIKTLENVGYEINKDLFLVNYDWRLVPGPSDGSIDGVVSGITAASISDGNFEYGVDYLGLAMRRAYDRWEQDHPGETLEEVDIIAHSTGGLVSRTYIQSPAYNGSFSGNDRLPKVKNLIMVGVPNRGASKAWNPLHDNWTGDPAYVVVLSKIMNRGFQKVVAGGTINGPDGPITKSTILDADGHPSRTKFIRLYVPTIQALLATYDFLDEGSGLTNVNFDNSIRNVWALDLNNKLDLFPTSDPNPFANNCTATIIFGMDGETATTVTRKTLNITGLIASFTDLVPRGSFIWETWYKDNAFEGNGDGTVPLESSLAQFVGDDRITRRPFASGTNTSGPTSHLGLMYNSDVQKAILGILGQSFRDDDISTDLHSSDWEALLSGSGIIAGSLSLLLDPVDGFVVDAKGRRFGYSDATGPVTEIPGSIWFGNADGIGWITGELARPLKLELTGRGEPYYVMASVIASDKTGGVVDSGFLAKGEKKTLPVAVGTASVSGRVTAANGRGVKGAFLFLTDGAAVQRTVYTNSFGYYRFLDVPAEVEYRLSVMSKRHAFHPSSRSIGLMDDLSDIDFTSAE